MPVFQTSLIFDDLDCFEESWLGILFKMFLYSNLSVFLMIRLVLKTLWEEEHRGKLLLSSHHIECIHMRVRAMLSAPCYCWPWPGSPDWVGVRKVSELLSLGSPASFPSSAVWEKLPCAVTVYSPSLRNGEILLHLLKEWVSECIIWNFLHVRLSVQF